MGVVERSWWALLGHDLAEKVAVQTGDGLGGGEAACMQAGGATVEGCGGSDSDGLDDLGTMSQVSVHCPCILADILRSGAKEGGNGMAAAWGM